MIKIIDASVAVKWFVLEPLRERALALLDEIQEAPQEFAVPELFFNEMLSTFCRLLDKAPKIHEYLDLIQNLGLTRLGNGREALAAAATLAKEHALSGYDAIYAANAQLVRGIWITADGVAHRKISRLGISQLLSARRSFSE